MSDELKRLLFIYTTIIILVLPLKAYNRKSSWNCYIKSSFLINQGKLKEAETLIDTYLKMSGDDYALLAEKAVVRKLQGGSFQEVKEILERSRTISSGYFRSTFLLASIMYDEYSKDRENTALLKKSSELADKVLVQNPLFFEGTVLAGIISVDLKEYKKAISLLKDAEKLNNTSYLVYYRMAACYSRMGKKDEELKALKKALNIRRENPEVLGRISDLLIENGKYGEASEYLEKLTALVPSDKNSLYRYLYSLFLAQESEQFLKKVKNYDIRGVNPIIYAKAIVLIGMEKYEAADKVMADVEKRDDKYYLLKSDIALRTGRYFDAWKMLGTLDVKFRKGSFYSMYIESMLGLTLYSDVLELYNSMPDDSSRKLGRNDLGNVLLACSKNGNYILASKVLERLLEKSEKNQKKRLELLKKRLEEFRRREMPEKLGCMGNLEAEILINFLKYRKDYESAVKYMEQGYRKCPGINKGLELSNLYWLAGRSDDSFRLLKKLFKRYKDVAAVMNSYAYTLAKEGKKLKKAADLAKKALEKSGNDPAIMDTYGYILLRSGDVKRAERYLEKAAEMLPFDKEVRGHLIDLYRKSGNKEKLKALELKLKKNHDKSGGDK